MVYVDLTEENAGWLLAAPGMPTLAAISNDLRRQSTQQHWVGTLPSTATSPTVSNRAGTIV